MTEHKNPPIDVHVERERTGQITSASIRFGPHYMAQVIDDGGNTTFQLVSTHHGFAVDASELDGELERLIDDVRASHPHTVVD